MQSREHHMFEEKKLPTPIYHVIKIFRRLKSLIFNVQMLKSTKHFVEHYKYNDNPNVIL